MQRQHTAVQRQPAVALRRLLHPERPAGDAEPAHEGGALPGAAVRPLPAGPRAGAVRAGARGAQHLRALRGGAHRLQAGAGALHRFLPLQPVRAAGRVHVGHVALRDGAGAHVAAGQAAGAALQPGQGAQPIPAGAGGRGGRNRGPVPDTD